jgi:hypothetical protein
MRAHIRRAVGWRADTASLSVWTQLAARAVAVLSITHKLRHGKSQFYISESR